MTPALWGILVVNILLLICWHKEEEPWESFLFCWLAGIVWTLCFMESMEGGLSSKAMVGVVLPYVLGSICTFSVVDFSYVNRYVRFLGRII